MRPGAGRALFPDSGQGDLHGSKMVPRSILANLSPQRKGHPVEGRRWVCGAARTADAEGTAADQGLAHPLQAMTTTSTLTPNHP